jgi:hypothetical protein
LLEILSIDALDQYTTSPLFTDAERAALDYVTELTKDKKVNPDTFARMSRHYSEREICEIVWLVASEHLYNMTNIVSTSILTCSVTSAAGGRTMQTLDQRSSWDLACLRKVRPHRHSSSIAHRGR